MADLKLSSLPSATSVNATDSIFLNNEGKTKTSPVSYLPTGANNGEYTINFEDILKESIKLHGIHFNLVDTAGIRETEDIVEKIGVDKAKKFASSSNSLNMISL